MKKFNVTAFALAAGLLWGFGVFLLALTTMWWGLGEMWIDMLADVYVGVNGSWLGAFAGFVWGFVDLFVGGMIFAWLYNYFAKKFK